MQRDLDSLFKYLKYLIVFIIIAGIYSVIWGPLADYSASLAPTRTFTVMGEGKVVTEPTLAKLSFSVVSEGFDPARVQAENSTTINKGIDFVKEQGITEDNIKTTGFNLTPRYTYIRETGRSFIDGYRQTQTVSLEIEDLSIVGDIISGLSSRGINQITSVSFDVTDEEKEELLNNARTKAFDDARDQAEDMAKSVGVRVGRVVSFSESGAGNRSVFLESKAYDMSVGEGSPSIEPGSQDINVNVSVTYEIK